MYNTGNPVPSSALEDMADNAQVFDGLVTQTSGTVTDRLGNTRRSFQQIVTDMGFNPVSGSFQAGATITEYNQCLLDTSTGTFYSWSGALPKVVATSSTPATAGGVGAGAWVDRTDVTLRSEFTKNGLSVSDISTLNGPTGSGNIGFSQTQSYANDSVGKKLQTVVCVDDFNDYYLVSSDWAPAFTAAFAHLNLIGNGGVVTLTPGDRYPVESSFNIASFCRIKGGGFLGSSHGNITNDFGTMPGIILNTSATITLYGSASLIGVQILRKGLSGYENGTSAFAGVAVSTADGYDDQLIKESTILGFSLGISAIGSQRVTLKDLKMDNLSCVKLANSRDISRFSSVHCWPWVTVGGIGADILYRSGSAFEIGSSTQPVDWLIMRDCFAYCYYRGASITNASFPLLDNFATDSDETLTNRGELIGVLIGSDVSHPRIINSKFTGNIGSGIHVNLNPSSSLPVVVHNCIFNKINSRAVYIEQGVVKLTNNDYSNTPIGVAVASANANTSIVCAFEHFSSSVDSPIYLTVDNQRVFFDDSCTYDGVIDIISGAELLPFSVDDAQITTTLTVPKYSKFIRVNPTTTKTISYINHSGEIGATITVRNGGTSTITFDLGEIVASKTISTNQIATLTKVSNTEWLVY